MQVAELKKASAFPRLCKPGECRRKSLLRLRLACQSDAVGRCLGRRVPLLGPEEAASPAPNFRGEKKKAVPVELFKFDPNRATKEELIRLVGRARYIAKKGGDKIHIGDEEYHLDEKTVKFVFQPILNVFFGIGEG